MVDRRKGPDTGNRGEAINNAGERLTNHNKAGRSGFCTLHYAPPGRNPFHVRLGATDAEMLEALRHAPSSRLDLMKRRPRLGLSAPQAIERLRKTGLETVSEWMKENGAHGRSVRFVHYRLLGRVLEVQRA
jgi:hypothetical protein